jgi:hypothetical protein
VYIDVIAWDDEGDADGNYRHIMEPGEVTVEEVEEVLRGHHGGPDAFRDRSGFPIIFGTTSRGKRIAVVYADQRDADCVVIYPVTAYPVDEPGG